MKKRTLLVPLIGLTLLLTACGKSGDQHAASSASSESTSSKVTSSSHDDSKSSSSSMSDSSSSDFSTTSGSSSSSSSSNSNGYTQVKSGDTISYLQNGTKIATYKSKDYGSTTAAQNAVQDYESASDNQGLPTVDLGYGITGAKDAGAGQLYINFPMGRWSITVRGLNEHADVTVNTAKNLVTQLQSKSLPVPDNRGSLMFDSNANATTIQWQDGTKLNTVSGANPAGVINVATSLR